MGERKDNAPIIAHLPVDSDIECILKNTTKLKRTGFRVHKDFSFETRRKRGKLLELRWESVKAVGDRKNPLIVDQLLIDGRKFSWTTDF